ncbi:hypothetical protein DDZ13_07665 [Coraliomargarita sinensis]|uniref:C4-dicarboxylate ABC transporter substrate-binding protein n=1 Tax=Coraliomargarita sinensis TaxID=2174842 RepID=A0A317ZG54_9BACT|nr:hypothetical protein [Coraliomargarita sinensis]PXA04400.1 hypothetical protein DDZ13_07665 [Coraliomargarita sinensis]
MKYSYLTLGFLVGLVAACILFPLFKPSGEAAGSGVMRMKIAHTLPVSHPVHAGIEHFAERVAAYSSGQIQLDIFPNGS